MASTITFRLADQDRAVLQAAAEQAGEGISAYFRRLAQAEVRRIRAERICGQLTQVAEAIEADRALRAEVELISGDGEDWPQWTGPLPG
jgi:hypothetical protein